MKIVVLCLSPSRGGLELYALEEIKQLTKHGHDCFAVVAPDGYLASALEKENIPFATLKLSFNRLPLITARTLNSILKKFDADILHFHWGKDLYLAALAKSMFGNKLALVHSRHMHYTRSKKDFIHRWYYHQIDLLLAGTKLLQKLARQHLVLADEKIKLLYIGVAEPAQGKTDCNLFFDDTNFIKRKLNLAIFGRIEHGKGQHVLINAMQEMVSNGKDISLTMIGHTMDADYQKKLQQNIKNNNLSKHIQFKSFVENATNCMRCFDVLVLTTYCEMFGLVLVEAMRAGVAVVGTNAGGVPEIIEHKTSGLLTDPGDSKNMQENIELLYAQPDLLKRLAFNGKQRADNLFSDELHYKKLEQALLLVKNK